MGANGQAELGRAIQELAPNEGIRIAASRYSPGLRIVEGAEYPSIKEAIDDYKSFHHQEARRVPSDRPG